MTSFAHNWCEFSGACLSARLRGLQVLEHECGNEAGKQARHLLGRFHHPALDPMAGHVLGARDKELHLQRLVGREISAGLGGEDVLHVIGHAPAPVLADGGVADDAHGVDEEVAVLLQGLELAQVGVVTAEREAGLVEACLHEVVPHPGGNGVHILEVLVKGGTRDAGVAAQLGHLHAVDRGDPHERIKRFNYAQTCVLL